MNSVRDLIPWEPIFVASSTGLFGTLLTIVVSLLRRRRIGIVRRVLVSLFAVGALAPWLLVRNFSERLAQANTTNRVDTAAGIPSDLLPRQYNVPQQQVIEAIIAATQQLGWEIVFRNDTSVEIEVPVARVGWFIDDLKVTLSEQNGITTVNAVSQSRVGRADLGENRRHVVQLFTTLDGLLP